MIHDEVRQSRVVIMDYRVSSAPRLAFRSPGATAR